MHEMTSDGLVFVSEMMDRVTLETNVVPVSIVGRKAVQAALQAASAMFSSMSITYERHSPPREFRTCRARLASGGEIEITNVAVRDSNGWICELHVDYDSDREHPKVLQAIKEALLKDLD